MRGLVFVLMLSACGEPQRPREPRPPTPDAALGPAFDGAPEALSADDCAHLVDHMLAVGVEEQRRDRAPELVATPAQVAEIRAAMIADMTPACQQWPRAVLACAIAATSTPAIAACTATP